MNVVARYHAVCVECGREWPKEYPGYTDKHELISELPPGWSYDHQTCPDCTPKAIEALKGPALTPEQRAILR